MQTQSDVAFCAIRFGSALFLFVVNEYNLTVCMGYMGYWTPIFPPALGCHSRRVISGYKSKPYSRGMLTQRKC